MYDEGIEFAFADPVPADVATSREQNRKDFEAGIITREEARQVIGMDVKAEGTFILPFSVVEVPAKESLRPTLKSLSSDSKTAFWRAFAAKTEAEERWFVNELKKLWGDQEKEVIRRLRAADSPDEALFDELEARNIFEAAMLPILTRVFERHYQDGLDLLTPQTPHEDSKQVDERARLWLATRSLQLAKLLNGTTIEQLRATLVAGFEAGESVPKLTTRVVEYYGKANKVRALMVARTETIAASVEGNLRGYENTGVERAEFYTAEDGRTCDICAPHHGEEYPIKETHGVIPLHPQCRCVFLPVI